MAGQAARRGLSVEEASEAALFVVGIVGLLLERVFLRTLEVMTVERWGTMRELD